MDDAAPFGALGGKQSHLRHQVMLDLVFDFQGTRQVDLGHVRPQVRRLDQCDQPKFSLDLCQSYPHLSP